MATPPDSTGPGSPPIRVTIQHPFLSHYRVPVFRELAARPGIKLLVVYGDTPGMPNVEPDGFAGRFETIEMKSLMGRSLLWVGSQIRYATKKNTDVLILTWNVRYLSLIPALIRARLTGVRTILWGHGYSKTETGLRSLYRRWVARLGSALLLYNHTSAAQFREFGWPADRVYVGLNSLDQTPMREASEAWADAPQKLEDFRIEKGFDQGPTILFVSRFDPENRLDLLVEAVAKLTEKYPHLQALIVGKGDDERQRLEELGESLGVRDRIRFLGAIYGEEKLAPYFLFSDVFCYPANIGLSILHAFGYGLPVVTSDHIAGQNPEIEALRPGENGLLYRHGDADSLAEALDQIFSDKDAARRMSEQALATVDNLFNIDTMVNGIEDSIRGRGSA